MRYLVLSPHYDDAEIACGATISRMVKAGTAIMVMVFAVQRRLDGTSFANMQNELKESSKILGFKYQECEFDARGLWQHRQRVLDVLYDIDREWRPDVVICPGLNETHQDHEVVAEEAFRAFKFSKLIAYDLPWNIRRESAKTMFVDVNEDDVEDKVRAVSCYCSQQPRDYLSAEAVFALAKMRGLQCGRKYAEAFEVYRWFL